ncbi:MAG: hypothetical protein IKO49_01085 [Bacilli bacterium]|nr:hypothetical protein [Clostridia bacterium]MBR4617892.1 hypothetical protein [Bacilli bacterium]
MIYDILIDLIKNNKDWKTFLEKEPRFITIKQCPWKDEDNNLLYPELYMLSYDGLFSDFNDEYVRLCRGCIVSVKDPNNPVMIVAPFTKFGNYGQSFCPEIDWSSALVEQKVDGILIKLFYYDNKWHWITNNGWNTNLPWKEMIKIPSKYKEIETDTCNTVQDLIDYCIKKNNATLSEFHPDYTYMFELISPKMRILVDNPKTDLVYLGCRNLYTYDEYPLDMAKAIIPGIKKFNTVKYFDLHNMDEVLQLCNSYKGDQDEGVVVVDKNFNRVKIKCEDYIRLKGYRRMFDTTDEQIWKGMREGTIDDALQVFPELNEKIQEIQKNVIKYKHVLEEYGKIGKNEFNNMLTLNDEKTARRLYAAWVNDNYKDMQFALFEGINEVPNYDRYLEHIKYKEILINLEREKIK